MKVHFIAIGGAVMHSLALCLRKDGYQVTGSDDEIFDPARTRLKQTGLLPEQLGWFPEKISPDLDAVVLGMHARHDNPELIRAKELGLKIFSFPAYVYERTQQKLRVVVGGSHGKTTVTAMIMHVLQQCGRQFDYLLGSPVDNFDLMVNLSEKNSLAILEGDEYLSSVLQPVPKFHLYRPHIAVITGIAWDHINAFPSFEAYVKQFEIFASLIEPGGKLIYCAADKHVQKIATKARKDITLRPYQAADYEISQEQFFLLHNKKKYTLHIFGAHNMFNLKAAWEVCRCLGISDEKFVEAIGTFRGAARRLELMMKSNELIVFRDFAHSPSKLKATIQAVKATFPDRKLTACMELHTYSSLTKDFLAQYRGSMSEADEPVIFVSRHALAIKKLPDLSVHDIIAAFDDSRLLVFDNKEALANYFKEHKWHHDVLLMMSSGDFEGLKWEQLMSENFSHRQNADVLNNFFTH